MSMATTVPRHNTYEKSCSMKSQKPDSRNPGSAEHSTAATNPDSHAPPIHRNADEDLTTIPF
jgi:hypothetical protein